MTSSEKWTPSGAPPGMLAQRFPVNSLQEITLNNGETISGRVYCTDELSGSIILQKALVHTTLASEIRIVSAGSVDKAFALTDESESSAVVPTPLSQPLPKIQKKVLEERERRAIRLAEERLIHINQKVRKTVDVLDIFWKSCFVLTPIYIFLPARHHPPDKQCLIAYLRPAGR